MPKAFQFTEAKIKAIGHPAAGRVYHKDTRFPGLQLCVTSAGAKTYYLVKRIGGKPSRVRLGTVEQLSVEQARTAAATVTGEVASGHDPQAERRKKREEPTLDVVWDQWLTTHAKPRKRTWKDDERQYKKYLASFHGRRISSIKPSDVAKWHAKTGENSGPVQANRAKALLATLLNYAIRLEMLVVNPCRSVPNFPEQSRERFLLPSEMKAFFEALADAGDPWHDLFQLALFTGARRGNVASMAWKEIDLDRMIWDIPASKTKNKKPAIIALPPPAVAILQSRWALSNGNPYVFPSTSSSGHAIDPRKAWDRVRAGMRQCPQCGQRAGGKPSQCPKCGEAIAFQQNKCHRCGEDVKEPAVCRKCNHALPDAKAVNLRMHDLRRSLGSWQATAGASLAIIGASLGHADLKSTQVYARLQLDTIRQSVDSAAAAMLTAGGQTKLLEGHSTPIKEGSDNKDS